MKNIYKLRHLQLIILFSILFMLPLNTPGNAQTFETLKSNASNIDCRGERDLSPQSSFPWRKLMSDYDKINKEFILDVSHLKSTISGGLIEIVIDLTRSRYFNAGEQLDELIQFTTTQAQEGRQLFFGPAARKDDLGTSRSTIANVSTFLCLWVDIDSPDKALPADQKKAEAKKLLDEFTQQLATYGLKPSYIVESGNGYHVYFLLDKFCLHPDTDWQNAQNALVRLAKADPLVRQPASLLRVPGTFNLKDPANPKAVKIIESLRLRYSLNDFRQLTVDLAKKYQENTKTPPTAIGHGKLGFKTPCIVSLLDPSEKPPMGARHTVRLVLATYFFHEGLSIEDAIKGVMHTTDDPKKAESDVRNIYKVLERDPERYSVGCTDETLLRSLVNAGVAVCDEKTCQFKQPKAKAGNDKKTQFSACFDGLVDVVDDSGNPRFLVKENGSLVMKETHETAECILIPPPPDKIVWRMPRAKEVLKYVTEDNDQLLFNDLVTYHQSISELPEGNYYQFLAAWDMHTYLHEMFGYSPIIWFHAIAARGKSRTAKGITFVSWRGVIQTTVQEAHIIRLATNCRSTIFFDIMDLSKKVQRSNTEDIMLNRFEQGVKIPRIMYPDLGAFADTEWYILYGPTIIASNKMIDDILETRSLQIVMPETDRIFENDVMEIDALPLRERLTAFRARRIGEQLPNIGKPVAGRLGDILKPIRQMVNLACSDEAWFMDFAKREEQSRRSAGYDTDEGKVVRAIINSLGKVENGHLFHKDTLAILNSGLQDRHHMNPLRLGRITKRLGFVSYTSGNLRGIYVNLELLDRLCLRYGIQPNGGTLTV
jgi:hypothetical protein